ncbi:MAG: hypothetical protein ACXW31_01745 [Thermoanaerobaculia bacterium]
MNTTDTTRSSFLAHRSSFVLIAVFASLPFLAPLLRGEVFTLRDHFDYFQPLRWFTATELREGRLPLWNPYNASGEPWLANPQTGVFYPPAWLHVVLPFATGYMLYLLFHMLVLGWGAYLFFAREASRGAAMVGAVALMFSGPLLSLLDVSNNFATFAWIPLALWCAAEGAWRRGGIVLALAFLAGEPLFAAVGALLYAIVSWRRRGDESSSVASKTRRLAGAGLLALGLSAIQLLPFLAFVRTTDRAGGTHASVVLADSMPFRDWLRIAVPPRLGDTVFDSPLGQQFVPVVYVGVIVITLALIGVAAPILRPRSDGWKTATPLLFWLALLAAAIVLSTGPVFLARLPLTLLRYPARLVPFGALALAALAVAGWDRVRPDRRWADLILIGLVLVDLVPRVRPLLQSGPFRRDVVPYARELGADTKILRVGVVDSGKRAAWMAGYLNLYDRRFDAFTPAPAVAADYVKRHGELLDSPNRRELSKRAIGWVLTSYDLPSPFEPVARQDGVTMYRNPGALPMAALMMYGPPRIIPVDVHLDTSRASVTVDAEREGVIVLHQQAAPGWRVTMDGQEAESIPVDGLFRGVRVARGRHEIVWVYRPPALLGGAIVTMLTLISLTLFSFVKRAR